MAKNNIVYLSLGSNIGDSRKIINSAIQDITNLYNIRFISRSSFYESSPVGKVKQNYFLNIVIAISTNLQAIELLNKLQNIENNFFRKRTIVWGPRTLDIDILLVSDKKINSAYLTVPHPELFNRLFVLIPLQEIIHDINILDFHLRKRISYLIKHTQDEVSLVL